MKAKPIKVIQAGNFAKYGKVIELTSNHQDGFDIIVTSESPGWRIAVYEVQRRTTGFMENHPTSKESFEPLYGTALLILAENSNPEDFEVFLLDKPVCLNEGIWHQIITLSEVAAVKITENLEVNSEFYYFENELNPMIYF
ncbi:MAG TPA: hypothetical protein GXX36_02585 [Clostridiaceae bacterium]|nr:hypothetical protein [Clostridiaceae bacterium]